MGWEDWSARLTRITLEGQSQTILAEDEGSDLVFKCGKRAVDGTVNVKVFLGMSSRDFRQ